MTKEAVKGLRDVKVALNKARSIVLVPPALPTLDNAVSTKLLLDLFVTKLNKPTKVLVPESYKFPQRIAEFVGYNQIPDEYATDKILPLAYKITVPEVSENTEVDWKLEDNTFQVTLKPKQGKVDLSKTSFGTEGERYDLLISIGAQTKDMLNEAYQGSQDAVENMVSINFDFHSLNNRHGEINIISETTSTVTELVYHLYKELGAKIEKESAELAMKSVLVSTDGLRRIASSESLKTILELEEQAERNVTDTLKSHYLSLGSKGLAFREEMLKTIKFDKNNQVVWAQVDASTLSKLGIEADILDGVEQLPYNICKDVRVALLGCEKSDNEWFYLAISNDSGIDLYPWANKLGGKGVAYIGTVTVNGDKETASKKVLDALNSEVFGQATITQPDTEDEQPQTSEEKEEVAKKGEEEPTAENEETDKTSEESEVIVTKEPDDTPEETKSPFKPAKKEDVDKFAEENSPKKKGQDNKSPFKKASDQDEDN